MTYVTENNPVRDSRWGDEQTMSREAIAAVVEEAHRHGVKVSIHSRGAGSTRDSALAGVDWIFHADLATEDDLDMVAAAGIPIMPAFTQGEIWAEHGIGVTRTGLDWTHKYPPIAAAVSAVGARQAYLDGELCGVFPDGITSFGMIQAASDAGNAAGLVFFVFDLLHLDGDDVGALSLIERKARLAELLSGVAPPLHYSDYHRGRGSAFHASGSPNRSAAICAKLVSWPWPFDWVPTRSATRPSGSKRISARLPGVPRDVSRKQTMPSPRSLPRSAAASRRAAKPSARSNCAISSRLAAKRLQSIVTRDRHDTGIG